MDHSEEYCLPLLRPSCSKAEQNHDEHDSFAERLGAK